jgi:hypothetical protein
MYTVNDVKRIVTFQNGATISNTAAETHLIKLVGAILVKCISATPKIFLISSSNYKYKRRL